MREAVPTIALVAVAVAVWCLPITLAAALVAWERIRNRPTTPVEQPTCICGEPLDHYDQAIALGNSWDDTPIYLDTLAAVEAARADWDEPARWVE